MSLAAIFGEALTGLLLADFLSGLIHWWEDRVGKEDGLLGRWVVRPNRQHHREPLAFVAAGIWFRSSTTFLAAGILSLIWLAAFGPGIIWASATISGAMANEVHRWAHVSARAPGPVRIMQAMGVLQSPGHHGWHHCNIRTVPQKYCVLTNFCNPLLDRIGLWARLEAGLEMLGVEIYREEAR